MIFEDLDVSVWKKAAPYVDTVLVPVLNVLPDDKLSLVTERENSRVAALEIERQLKGRILLMPYIAYAGDEPSFYAYMAGVEENIRGMGFTYVFFAVDENMARLPRMRPFHLIAVPELAEDVKNRNNQIRQLCEQIIQKWKEEE